MIYQMCSRMRRSTAEFQTNRFFSDFMPEAGRQACRSAAAYEKCFMSASREQHIAAVGTRMSKLAQDTSVVVKNQPC